MLVHCFKQIEENTQRKQHAMSSFAGSLTLNAAYVEKVLKRSSKGNTNSIDTTERKQNKQLHQLFTNMYSISWQKNTDQKERENINRLLIILTTAERRSTFSLGSHVLSLLRHRFIRFALGATWRFQRAKYLDERAKREIISNRFATSSTLQRLARSNEWTPCMFSRSFPPAHLFLNNCIVKFLWGNKVCKSFQWSSLFFGREAILCGTVAFRSPQSLQDPSSLLWQSWKLFLVEVVPLVSNILGALEN